MVRVCWWTKKEPLRGRGSLRKLIRSYADAVTVCVRERTHSSSASGLFWRSERTSARPTQRSSAPGCASTKPRNRVAWYSYAHVEIPARDTRSRVRLHARGAARGRRGLAEAEQQRVAAASLAAHRRGCRHRCSRPRSLPGSSAEPLRSALARYHRLEPEHVFVANGADQVLDCLFRAFVGPGDTLVRTEPGYSLLPVLATLFSACDVGVPVEPDGSLPSQFASQDAVLRIVVNPNSPTGHWIEPAGAGTIAGRCVRCDRHRRGLLRFRAGIVCRTPRHAPQLDRGAHAVEVACARRSAHRLRACRSRDHRRSQRGPRLVPGRSLRNRGRARGTRR